MWRTFLFASLTFVSIAVAQAAGTQTKGPEAIDAERMKLKDARERGGLLLSTDPYGEAAQTLRYLDQGWGVPETLWYYHADQGSVLISRDILLNLEQATSQERLLSPENLTRFRFLTQKKTPNNPDGLPVGFSRHGDELGFTCAACHTGQLVYKGTAIRVDGAPAMIDMQGFFTAIRDAEKATLADPEKLARFAAALPSKSKSGDNLKDAQKLLSGSLAWFDDYLAVNSSSTQEGFGRIDAVGRIINQVIRFTSDSKNSLEPNAPTSFPLLWDAPRHDYVQWIAFAPNAGPGSLGRNVGEVIGVFGRVEVRQYKTKEEAKKGYPSTVEGHALVSMESTLHGLKSPVWPEDILPALDQARVARGKTLYQDNCSGCHALLDRDDPRRKVTAMVTGINVVGTDPTSAENLIKARAPTGKLEGTINNKGELFGAEASALDLLGNLGMGVLTSQPTAAIRAMAYAKGNGLETTPKQGHHPSSPTDPTVEMMSYKARPLNGIWASSPYLHNGSVPTLYDLLLPPAQRPKQFSVGRWDFDPQKVGYRSDGQIPWVLDTTLKGNSNQGHPFGTTLSEDDRWALVEYLKSL